MIDDWVLGRTEILSKVTEKAWHLQGSESGTTELVFCGNYRVERLVKHSSLGLDDQSISSSAGVITKGQSYYHVDANSVVPVRGT